MRTCSQGDGGLETSYCSPKHRNRGMATQLTTHPHSPTNHQGRCRSPLIRPACRHDGSTANLYAVPPNCKQKIFVGSSRAGTPHAERTAAEPGDPRSSLFMVSMSCAPQSIGGRRERFHAPQAVFLKRFSTVALRSTRRHRTEAVSSRPIITAPVRRRSNDSALLAKVTSAAARPPGRPYRLSLETIPRRPTLVVCAIESASANVILIDHQDILSAASRQERHRDKVGGGPKTRPADDFSFAAWLPPRGRRHHRRFAQMAAGLLHRASRQGRDRSTAQTYLSTYAPFDICGLLAAASRTFAIGQVRGQVTRADLHHRQCDQPTGVCEPRLGRPGARSGRWRE